MGGNIMLIAHTPRFIVVKNALASKWTLFLSHLNSTHTGRAVQQAHSGGKLLLPFFIKPQMQSWFSALLYLSLSFSTSGRALRKHGEGMHSDTTKGHFTHQHCDQQLRLLWASRVSLVCYSPTICCTQFTSLRLYYCII